MNQLCKVCNEPAAGFHFGAFTCEGCKSFFGRAHVNPTAAVAIECKTGGGRCVIDKKNRTSCKACRLKKCLAAGMSKSGSRYGRRSNWFKIHCLLQQQQQQQQQRQQLFPRRFQDECGHGGGGGYGDDCCSGPPRSRPAPLSPSLPVPLSRMSLLFGFAPKSRGAPLPRSEHSAFHETVKSDYCSDHGGCNDSGNDDDGDDDDDRPIDLTVRQSITKDDDNNNETTDKHDTRRRSAYLLKQEYNRDSAAPLDLTRANCRHFGIRS